MAGAGKRAAAPPARAWLALAALMGLASCVFAAEAPLLAPGEARQPFAGAYRVTQNGVVDRGGLLFEADGPGYRLTRDTGAAPIGGVIATPIAETPEEDFIVQAPIAGGYAYAFAWRRGDGWRVAYDPRAFAIEAGDAARAGAICVEQPSGECRFATSADLRAFYVALVHPRYVAADAAPPRYLDLTPLAAEEP